MSSAPPADEAGTYALERFSDDAAAFLGAMEIEDAIFVGNSMSGLISQITALRHPVRVAGLVLIGTG